MSNIQGKKILILGGGNPSLEIVREAKKLGLHTIVTDYLSTGVAKEIADESLSISTSDLEALNKYIKNNDISGVISGPSEFNTHNMIKLCRIANLPCYVNEYQWDSCSNKETYKSLCRKYGVPCIPEFDINQPSKFEYPIVVKPIDSCSSKGISKCNNYEEYIKARNYALENSKSKKYIVEKYISSDGYGVSAWYVANNGDIRLSLFGDKYTVDTENALISAVSISPSKLIDDFIDRINPHVIEMFKGLGLQNGSFFMQAIPEHDIYFHDMGLRLSGGLIFKLTEPITGINDVKMMINYSVGEDFSSSEEMNKVDPYLKGKYAVSLCIPLKVGKIKTIKGLKEISEIPSITTITQYYQEGNMIKPEDFGTLQQHFARFKFVVSSYKEIEDTINYIQNTLQIRSIDNEDMIYKYFDTERLKK